LDIAMVSRGMHTTRTQRIFGGCCYVVVCLGFVSIVAKRSTFQSILPNQTSTCHISAGHVEDIHKDDHNGLIYIGYRREGGVKNTTMALKARSKYRANKDCVLGIIKKAISIYGVRISLEPF
jgi:hypothetical protein